ncbi:sigma factor [Reichenbachiella ulvae]|uniref:RNA polymerase sigma-70 factor, ECF subfamily n=1 Tax=Reichenbachiella ulvae TaxID=2980104 RepID=A0ABT3CZS6_9BACT|nr:sigma factor [Reichenbachiella ulvae]MCV9389196.1 hypothetical protein [Reichenbachiella ulvae]
MDTEKLWQQYKNSINQFILSKVNDHEDAADILQEVGLKLALARDRTIHNPKAWLYQVTRNTIADYYRKINRTVETWSSNSSPSACACDLVGFVIQHYLPDTYAQALYLSDVENIPQQQVADRLQLSLSATKSRIKRARKKLRAMISDCVDINYNSSGQIVEYELKTDCELPVDLQKEMKKLNFSL